MSRSFHRHWLALGWPPKTHARPPARHTVRPRRQGPLPGAETAQTGLRAQQALSGDPLVDRLLTDEHLGPAALGLAVPWNQVFFSLPPNLCQMQDGVRSLRQGGAKHLQVRPAGTSARGLRVPRTVGSVLRWRVENLWLWEGPGSCLCTSPRCRAPAPRPDEACHFPQGCALPQHGHDC